MILKGRKHKSRLKRLASKCCMKQRNKGVHAIQLVQHNCIIHMYPRYVFFFTKLLLNDI